MLKAGKNNLVFEIGVEEIPAQYVKTMADSLGANAVEMLRSLRLNYGSLNVYFTPRRFALLVNELDDSQEDVTKTVKGPNVKAAYESDGKTPTRALLGFLGKLGKQPEDVVLESDGKHEYVAVQVTYEGQKTAELLTKPLAELVKSIYSPNPMRWNSYKFKFIRPIRWLLAYYGETLLPVEIECAVAGGVTYGHRTLADGPVTVQNADQYANELANAYVILDVEERKRLIRSQIADLEQTHGFQVELDEALLDKVANIVEYPTCAVGHFEEKYLALPECIIKNPLKTQQCYFPVYRDGKIDNSFVYVRNGGTYFLDQVTRGNERVLRPRLADAQFFYENDCEHTLKEFSTQLDNVVFVEKVGSYTDKAARTKAIALKVAALVGYEDNDKISEAVSVLKADLVSSVVREYTDIQGVVGGVFARKDGYAEDICTTISEQYLPNFSGDALPSCQLSAVVSIADKLDTIMSLCAAGLKPRGSADPYGLRRQTLGIFLIALDQGFDIDIDQLIEECAALYKEYYAAEGEDTKAYVEFLDSFFLQRLKVFLHEIKGIPMDDIDKISVDDLNIVKSMKKAEMIAAIGDTDWYQQFIQVFNRIQKLIKKERANAEFSPAVDDEEAANMFRVFREKRELIISLVDEEKYGEAIKLIAECGISIMDFMEMYRALCDDDVKRSNRIAFFSDFCSICGRIIQLGQ